MVMDVFKPDCELVWWSGDFPTVSPLIMVLTIRERMPAITALRRLMVTWMDCPELIAKSTYHQPYDTDDDAAIDFKHHVWLNYCQTFYVHFGRPPIVPMRLPIA